VQLGRGGRLGEGGVGSWEEGGQGAVVRAAEVWLRHLDSACIVRRETAEAPTPLSEGRQQKHQHHHQQQQQQLCGVQGVVNKSLDDPAPLLAIVAACC
jgi:hypothetical protein